jgi:hypothetical protein
MSFSFSLSSLLNGDGLCYRVTGILLCLCVDVFVYSEVYVTIYAGHTYVKCMQISLVLQEEIVHSTTCVFIRRSHAMLNPKEFAVMLYFLCLEKEAQSFLQQHLHLSLAISFTCFMVFNVKIQ